MGHLSDSQQHTRHRGQKSKRTPALERKLRQLVARNPRITLRELAHVMGNIVSHQAIKNWCIELRLPYRRTHGKESKLTSDVEKRLRAFIAKKPCASYKEIAAELNTPLQTVVDWMTKRLGFPRSGRRGPPGKLTPEVEKRLRSLVAERPLACYKDLAAELRVALPTVIIWVKRLKLPYHPKWQRKKPARGTRPGAGVANDET